MTGGVTGAFLFFFPQTVLLALAMNLCEMTWMRRLLSAILLAMLAAAGLHLELAGLDPGDYLSGIMIIALAWAVYPTVAFAKMNTYAPDWVEKFTGLQQTWLRVFFLFWIRDNAINIDHYELAKYAMPAILGFGCIVGVFSAVFFRFGGWLLSVQSVISIFLVGLFLNTGIAAREMVLAWVLILAGTSLLSSLPAPFILRRAEAAAIGGGLYLGLMTLLDMGFSDDVMLASGWAILLSLIGAYSWIKTLPEENNETASGAENSRAARLFTFIRIAIQAGLLIPLWARLVVI